MIILTPIYRPGTDKLAYHYEWTWEKILAIVELRAGLGYVSEGFISLILSHAFPGDGMPEAERMKSEVFPFIENLGLLEKVDGRKHRKSDEYSNMDVDQIKKLYNRGYNSTFISLAIQRRVWPIRKRLMQSIKNGELARDIPGTRLPKTGFEMTLAGALNVCQEARDDWARRGLTVPPIAQNWDLNLQEIADKVLAEARRKLETGEYGPPKRKLNTWTDIIHRPRNSLFTANVPTQDAASAEQQAKDAQADTTQIMDPESANRLNLPTADFTYVDEFLQSPSHGIPPQAAVEETKSAAPIWDDDMSMTEDADYDDGAVMYQVPPPSLVTEADTDRHAFRVNDDEPGFDSPDQAHDSNDESDEEMDVPLIQLLRRHESTRASVVPRTDS